MHIYNNISLKCSIKMLQKKWDTIFIQDIPTVNVYNEKRQDLSLYTVYRPRFCSVSLCTYKTHALCEIFFWKSCRLCDNVEKYSRTRPATDGSIRGRMRFFMPDKQGKNADTLRICITYCFPTATTNKRKRLNVTLDDKWPSFSPSSVELYELLTSQLISYAYETYTDVCRRSRYSD
jgi:hypothetical protein